MTDERPFTAREKRQAAEREVAMRKRVYWAKVAEGRMTRRDCLRGIGVMEAIAADYAAQEAADRPDLFGPKGMIGV